MADGDDLVIGENNQAQSTTQLVLTLNSSPKTLLKVGTGGGASIGVHGIGATGLKGEGGAFGVDGDGGISGFGVRGTSTSGAGVRGISTSQEGVFGTSKSGIGVSGSSEDDAGVLGSSDTGIGVRGSVGFSPFPLPANVGVLGESNVGRPFAHIRSRTLPCAPVPCPARLFTRKRMASCLAWPRRPRRRSPSMAKALTVSAALPT